MKKETSVNLPEKVGRGRVLGWHSLIELTGCPADRLSEVATLKALLVTVVTQAGGTVVRTVFHRFKPWGVSGVVVISESHVTLHTWPEHGYAAVDVFSCSRKLRAAQIARELGRALGARAVQRRALRRGPVIPPSLRAKS